MREYEKKEESAPVVVAKDNGAVATDGVELGEIDKKSCSLIDPSCESCQ